jgi:glyoxylase-like metal-dependent hydrolase (beta-lactamase superfamily II)
MSADAVPQIEPEELARRLEKGEPIQVLDVRAPDQVEQSRITFGAALDFRALPGSRVAQLPSLDSLRLDPAIPVAVVCGHGNSSKKATALLREGGLDAFSMSGGMARWETVYLPRRLPGTKRLEHVIQVDRVGKGALGYVLVSDGDALVVDPGRHVERYEQVLTGVRATPVAVLDTHVHADYLSGAPEAARRWRVPYFLHSADASSPYDGTPGRVQYRAIAEGDHVALGGAVLRVVHVPGHTLGSIALIADDELALTGDFLFVASVGRPDLGGKADEWIPLLWRSLERARSEWPGRLLVLPAHYASEQERRDDRTVGARFDAIEATSDAPHVRDEHAFHRWIVQRIKPFPEAYRTIKLANLGLYEVGPREAETLEFGPNVCAV